MTVTINVPYLFEAEHYPPRARNAVTSVFGGMMTVEVDSVTSQEAPLVVTWREDEFRQSTTHEAYSHEGHIVLPVIGRSREAVDIHDVTPVDLYDYPVVHGSMNRSDMKPDDAPWEKLRCMKIGEARIYDETRWSEAVERIKQTVKDAAAECVFIDGKLFRKGELPKLEATVDFIGAGTYVRIRLAHRQEGDGAHTLVLPLAEYESLAEWARYRAAGDDEAGTIREKVEVSIVTPELMPPTDGIKREVLRFSDFLFQEDIKFRELEDDTIDQWKTVRRAIAAAKGDATQENVDDLIDQWQVFFELEARDKNARHEKFGSRHRLEQDFHYQAFRALRHVWDAKPIAPKMAAEFRTLKP